MIVSQRKLTKLSVKAVTAHVVPSRWADAVPAPVAEGPDNLVQHRIIRINSPALSHRHMVRRIEAGGTDIADGTGQPLLAVNGISGSQSVAVVLHQPQIMAVTECFYGRQIEGVAQRMSNHHGFCLLRIRLLQHRHIDIVLRYRHVHEYRHRAVLDKRCHCGRKTGSYGDHLIAAFHPPFAEKRGRQRHKGNEIRGGTRIYQGTVFHAQISGQFLFKFIRIPAGSQPEFQGTVYQIHHLTAVIYTGRIGDPVSLFERLLLIVIGIAVSFYHIQDLLFRFLLCLIFKHCIIPLCIESRVR